MSSYSQTVSFYLVFCETMIVRLGLTLQCEAAGCIFLFAELKEEVNRCCSNCYDLIVQLLDQNPSGSNDGESSGVLPMPSTCWLDLLLPTDNLKQGPASEVGIQFPVLLFFMRRPSNGLEFYLSGILVSLYHHYSAGCWMSVVRWEPILSRSNCALAASWDLLGPRWHFSVFFRRTVQMDGWWDQCHSLR